MICRGHLALVLHAHLPFVRHPEHPHHLEEHWLYEAITDSYLPLIDVLRRAAERGSRFRLTLSLSPTLLSMLGDSLLKARYLDYLGRLQALCASEVARYPGDATRRYLARYYHDRITGLRELYLDTLGGDLIGAWRELERAGTVELMTTAATHGYLPLLRSVPSAVSAQLRVAADFFRALFGREPGGVWLPECGYFPGLESEVEQAGFRWFVLDAHGLQQGRPPPPCDVYAPVAAGGVAVFGRDPESSREIWSREHGYPGHPAYREYHRDIGLDGDAAALAGFLPPGVTAAPTGIKYHRVTGITEDKALYDRQAAKARAAIDAERFVQARCRLLARLQGSPRAPVIVAPFDAELFGHWWFEGPTFLGEVIRRLDAGRGPEPITLGEYLTRYGTGGEVEPAASSWGERGYNASWLRPETGWVHLRLHQAAEDLAGLVRRRAASPGGDLVPRLLRQAARSLLLAQSSDWTFYLGRGGGADYAERRLRDQFARFRSLTEGLKSGQLDERRLNALERMDNLFPDLDLRHFA